MQVITLHAYYFPTTTAKVLTNGLGKKCRRDGETLRVTEDMCPQSNSQVSKLSLTSP